MVCVCPTMPKRGAVTSTTRRSRSFLWPVVSPCTGAAKASAAAPPGPRVPAPAGEEGAAAPAAGGTSEGPGGRRRKHPRPAVPPAGRATPDEAPPQPGEAPEPLRQRRAHRLGLLQAIAEL